MIDGSEKCNQQLAFELQNSHVSEKRSNHYYVSLNEHQFKGTHTPRVHVGWEYRHSGPTV